MVMEGRLYVPYRRAMLLINGALTAEDEVPELQALEALKDTIRWGTPGNVPYLGNPVDGMYPYPEDLCFNCGVPVSPDFPLLGLVWADAALRHLLATLTASNPDRSSYAQSLGKSMLWGVEEQACKALTGYRVQLRDPLVQRATFMVLTSMNQLCHWCGTNMQDGCRLLPDLMRRLLAKANMPHLDPQHATTEAKVFLAGTPWLPHVPAAPAAPAAPPAPVAPAAAAAAAEAAAPPVAPLGTGPAAQLQSHPLPDAAEAAASAALVGLAIGAAPSTRPGAGALPAATESVGVQAAPSQSAPAAPAAPAAPPDPLADQLRELEQNLQARRMGLREEGKANK